MKTWQNKVLRKTAGTLLTAIVSIGLFVGIVYAAGYSFTVGGQVVLRGAGQDDYIFIDTDGDTDYAGEAFYFGFPNKAGLFSGVGTAVDATNHVWEDRAEAAVGIMTSISTESANAWIQSSGQAKVLTQWDGDIIITLGD